MFIHHPTSIAQEREALIHSNLIFALFELLNAFLMVILQLFQTNRKIHVISYARALSTCQWRANHFVLPGKIEIVILNNTLFGTQQWNYLCLTELDPLSILNMFKKKLDVGNRCPTFNLFLYRLKVDVNMFDNLLQLGQTHFWLTGKVHPLRIQTIRQCGSHFATDKLLTFYPLHQHIKGGYLNSECHNELQG